MRIAGAATRRHRPRFVTLSARTHAGPARATSCLSWCFACGTRPWGGGDARGQKAEAQPELVRLGPGDRGPGHRCRYGDGRDWPHCDQPATADRVCPATGLIARALVARHISQLGRGGSSRLALVSFLLLATIHGYLRLTTAVLQHMDKAVPGKHAVLLRFAPVCSGSLQFAPVCSGGLSPS